MQICRKLAAVIRDADALAGRNRIAARHLCAGGQVRAILPPIIDSTRPSIICRRTLLTADSEWQEIDFFQPSDIHEDIQERFVTLHTRNYKGRSYFRVFYRFPGGRPALEEYLKYIDAEGIDWKAGRAPGIHQGS